MSDLAIRVDNLSKRYLVGHQSPEKYTALRDVLMRNLRGIFRTTRDIMRGRQIVAGDEVEEFWALQDVSFEIERGDAVGIIGRNGAGKSTLLKILSRITEPTTGRIELNGRVASLLEVGTGFHPELTGRENIFLNGAILGMTRKEISRKFDEIVAFAEVEKFVDTPVKRYSSGMYVRLAFAVAANLEPDILIVDEVLAVGDAEFQKKCLGKMEDVSRNEGRTVLFVSHQLSAVSALCDKAICLSKGQLMMFGGAEETLQHYTKLSVADAGSAKDLRDHKGRKGKGELFILEAEIYGERDGKRLPTPRMGDDLSVRFLVENRADLAPEQIRLSVAIKTITGQKVLHVCNEDDGFVFPKSEQSWIRVFLPNLQLYPGTYCVTLWVGSARYYDYDHVEDCLTFEVGAQIDSPRAFRTDWSQGLFLHTSSWSLQ